jgi:hypothetical protein
MSFAVENIRITLFKPLFLQGKTISYILRGTAWGMCF